MPEQKKNYIQYITGIRGLAILMVVLFHLLPQGFPNAFYGVDIFFVLSGYLLFYGYRKEQEFSFPLFLKKKIIRIFPSLFVFIAITILAFIPFLYQTNDAYLLGKSCLTSLLGISNFYYIKTYSDYFATDSNLNPLLHTWYLSVVLQVYCFWGLCAALLQRSSLSLRITCVYAIAITSFFYYFSYDIQQILIKFGINGWGQVSAVSYYDSFGRLWQVLAGGLVFLLPTWRNKSISLALFYSALLVLCGLAFYNDTLPVWSSILIVLGTIFVLKYADEVRFSALLENKPLLYIGKISFSLYLVHFPVFVFFRRWEREEPNALWIILLLLISLICAWILWSLVEKRKFSKRGWLSLFSIAFLCTGVIRGAYKLRLIWDVHVVPYPIYTLSEEHVTCAESVRAGYNERMLRGDTGTQQLLRDNGTVLPVLSLSGRQAKPQFVLVGNSVAQQLYAGFHEICKERNIPGIHLTTIVYPMWDNHVWMTDSYCWTKDKAEAFVYWLRQQPELHTVVVSFLWKHKDSAAYESSYTTWEGKRIKRSAKTRFQQVRDFCEQMRKAGKHVVILTPTPVFMEFSDKSQLGKGEDYVQWRMQRKWPVKQQLENDPFIISEREYMRFNEEVFDFLQDLEQKGYCKLLHIEKGIFREGNFSGLHHGTLFCRDKTHITPAASIYIMQGVADEFESLIKQNQATPVRE